MEYGALSLIPPAAMLAFAMKTKKSFEALIFGTLVACVIMHGVNFIGPWCTLLLEQCSSKNNQYILLLCGMFGGLIFLLREVKGTAGFSAFVSRYCKSERSVMLTSVAMGIAIFVDDYLNIMTIGTCMKDVCDKRGIPRQALAYVIDSTGAPVCALLPFSTWVVFYSGIFFQEKGIVDMGFASGLDVYFHAVPFMFYPICALLIVMLFAAGIMPKLPPMKQAYMEARQLREKHRAALGEVGATGVNLEGAGPMNFREVSPATDPVDIRAGKESGNIFDFLIPIAVLIGVTIYTHDMLISIVCTLAVCMALYLPRRKMTFTRFVELFWEGFADILPVLGILLASFMIKKVCDDMGLPGYIIGLAEPVMNAHFMAAAIFIIIAVLTFVTSSFWGIEAIAVSIVVPLATSMGADVMLTLGAIVSGGVFGSHACFYSDATVLSSATCDIDNVSHAMTQLPYALLGAVAATGLYLAMGFMV